MWTWSRRTGGIGFALAFLLFLGLLVLFVDLRVWRTGYADSFDHVELMKPAYEWTAEQIRSGTFPLWNPHQLAGRPTLATLQGGMLHPFHLVYLVCPVDVGMALSILVHLSLAGAATFWFGRRIGLGAVACLLAAVLVCLRGSHIGATSNLAILESLAWLAPGFVAALEITRHGYRRGVLAMAACVAISLLAGFPQMTLYGVYAWLFYVLALSIAERASVRSMSLGLLACGVAIALGAMIAAAQLLPALDLAAAGVRSRGAIPLQQMYPFGLEGHETLIGGLARALETRVAVSELAWSFGVVGLVLVPFSLLARAQRAHAVVLAVLGTLTLAVAAGPASPIFDVYLRLPELASFRMPGRVLAVTDFCFAILAAIGLQGVLHAWTSWLARPAGDRRAADASPGLFRAAASLRGPQVLAAVVVAAALVEIFSAPVARTAEAARQRAARWDAVSEPSAVFDRLRDDPARVWVWDGAGGNRLPWKVASLLHVRSLSDYDAMFTKRQGDYFGYLMWGARSRDGEAPERRPRRPFYGRTRVAGGGVDSAGVLARRRLADLAGARYVAVAHRLATRSPFAEVLDGEEFAATGLRDARFSLFESKRAMPRAHVVHRVEQAPATDLLLARLSQPTFEPTDLGFVEGNFDPSRVAPLADGAARERVEIVRDALHAVDLAVELEAPGLVVLADAWETGWSVLVDGRPEVIWPTNHLFRGVFVEAGRHVIEFRYRPRSFSLGVAASLAGTLTWAGLAIAPAFVRQAEGGSTPGRHRRSR